MANRQPRKYSNKPVELDGYTFASKLERDRYADLKLLAYAGKVTDLRLQVAYPLIVNGEKVCTYVADFVYTDTDTGQSVVEDAKGYVTPVYNLKRKLMHAIHSITIREYLSLGQIRRRINRSK